MRELRFRITYQHGKTGRITQRFMELGEPIPHLGEGWQIIGKDQFIGLKDRNGKDVLEADIVKASIYSDEPESILEVRYDGGCFVIDYHDSESDFVPVGWFVGSVEVIDNIHENPELLKLK